MSIDVAGLFREHQAGLFRYLLRLTGDEERAKDAVQFAFLKMLERPPENANPKAWLYRVATNAVREWGRTAGHRRRLEAESGYAPALGDGPPGPERRIEQAEAKARFARVLQHLEERDRTLLLMREEGFTHREMAEALDTTTGSVGTLLARALKKATAAIAKEV